MYSDQLNKYFLNQISSNCYTDKTHIALLTFYADNVYLHYIFKVDNCDYIAKLHLAVLRGLTNIFLNNYIVNFCDAAPYISTTSL